MEQRAKRIHDLIIGSQKSYQELEKLTGIKKSSLQRYASGITSKIPLTAIEKLAKAFSVSESYIMWGEEKQSAESELSLRKRKFIKRVKKMTDEQLDRLERILDLVENTNI